VALGSDGGASIRVPAAMCGIFGLKPQRGRVSLAPDLEGWHGLSALGCLSRTVADTALWLDVVSGGSEEPGAPPPPERPFAEAARTPPGKLRVAWSTRPPRAIAPPMLSDLVRDTVADTAALLRSLGHDVAQQDPDWGGIGNTITAYFLKGVADDVARVPHPERLERRTRNFRRLGGILPDFLWERARLARESDTARVNALFDSFDVLLMPVMADTAVPVRRWEGQGALRTVLGMSRFYPYCVPWNVIGNPAMSVPAGFAPDGMPLAVQVVGRPGDETTLLSLAAQLEAERPWAQERPAIG
jgi:amidase